MSRSGFQPPVTNTVKVCKCYHSNATTTNHNQNVFKNRLEKCPMCNIGYVGKSVENLKINRPSYMKTVNPDFQNLEYKKEIPTSNLNTNTVTSVRRV